MRMVLLASCFLVALAVAEATPQFRGGGNFRGRTRNRTPNMNFRRTNSGNPFAAQPVDPVPAAPAAPVDSPPFVSGFSFPSQQPFGTIGQAIPVQPPNIHIRGPVSNRPSVPRPAPRPVPVPFAQSVCPAGVRLSKAEPTTSKNFCDTDSKCGIEGGFCIPENEKCNGNTKSTDGYCNANGNASCKCCLKPTVYMRDIENTIAFALRDLAPYHKGPGSSYRYLNVTAQGALMNFTRVLVNHLPLRDPVKIFLNCLSKQLASWNQDISGACLEHIYSQCQSEATKLTGDTGLPLSREWIGCKNFASFKHRDFRSYPCGVWTTFHAITVDVLTLVGLQQDVSDSLWALHGMVYNFPWCIDCQTHFLDMWKTRKAEEMNTPYDVTRWLWSAHNQVSVRIATEKKNPHLEPNRPKSLFPGYKVCQYCWVEDVQGNFIIHDRQVLHYLAELYNTNAIIQDCSLPANIRHRDALCGR